MKVSGEQETWTGFCTLAGELEQDEHVPAVSLHGSSATDSDLRIAGISLWGTPSDNKSPIDRWIRSTSRHGSDPRPANGN